MNLVKRNNETNSSFLTPQQLEHNSKRTSEIVLEDENVTGEKKSNHQCRGREWQANILQRRYKSRLVPHDRTSVSYTYHYYIFPLRLKIRPRILI